MAESPRVGEFASTPTSAAGVSSAATTTAANGEIRTFPNTLWDQVERVYLRLTKGRHDLKRVKAYMEARAEMARTWAKSMNKASAQPELEDSSSLGALWHDMKETGVAQAKQQEAFAVVCMEIAAALEAQIVEVKKQKTSLHERWTRLLADVKKKQQAHDKALRDYQESVKQAETAIMNRDSTHEQKMPDKAIQKAEKTAKSALAVVDSQHAAYQKSVQQLQEVQAQQDATCADLLTQFERLERTRMRTFLEQLDRWASQHDTLKAQLDSVAASLHTHANAVNIDADMQEFIRANNTGKVPPPHVEYVPCRSQILDHANGGVGASATQNVSGNLAAPVATFVPPSPGNQANVMASSPAAAAPSAISLAAAGPSAPVGGALAGGDVAVALYDFDANEPDDLGFKAGATIKLTMCSDAEDWWQGELNGKTGIFPKAYVQKQGAAPNTAGAPAGSAAALSAAPIVPLASEAVAAEGVVAHNPGVAAGAPVAPAAAAGAGGAEVPKLLDAQCAALFDFDGQDEDELSFKAGQNLIITGELNGWYLGKVEGSEKVGIFPSNFVQMSGR